MASNKEAQGTGKHPHKSTEEPFPHRKDEGTAGGKSSGEEPRKASGGKGGGESRQAAGGDDLKQREYRDDQGNVHHHTRTYQDQHGSK